jgi:hypothetical protein
MRGRYGVLQKVNRNTILLRKALKQTAWLFLIPAALVLGLVAGEFYRGIAESMRASREIPRIELRAQERLEQYIRGN